MTGHLYAAIAARVLAALAVAATVWLAFLGHPWLAVLAGWFAFLALFLGGRFHLGHHRTIADNRPKETTTR